ncbi:MAG TPA: GNAT family N-acetyltransferase [Thermomicrobiales bacterium]|nr:GNAT family N-acetyltransferase [Thermomicrobiales bacterium]
MTTGAPRIRPATGGDVPAMLDVFAGAFANDPHTRLQIAWQGADAMRRGMDAAMRSWLAAPAAHLLVAEDAASLAVLGWACWAEVAPEREAGPVPGDEQAPAVSTSPIEALQRLTGDDIRQCQRDVLARYGAVDVLVAIAVDPAHQSRGVGSLLIRWGTQRADARDRVCWVHASEAGSRAFARHGFDPHRDLTIELAPFAPPGDDRTWGTVRFRSMTRQPRTDDSA